ncbi:MAG: hypothetical protein AAF355_10030 [Myxococcota bacterium]
MVAKGSSKGSSDAPLHVVGRAVVFRGVGFWFAVSVLLFGMFSLPVSTGVAQANEEVATFDKDDGIPINLSLELAYDRVIVDFVSTSDVSPVCSDGSSDGCTVNGFSTSMIRGVGGIGYGLFSLEASIAYAPRSSLDFGQTTLGLRIETSSDALVSLYIRGAYLKRFGVLTGSGGSLGVGLQLRPIEELTFFAHARVDAATVPGSIQDQGALFSYATSFGCGMRVAMFP